MLKLIVLDFTKPFVLECDASSTGLAEILTQEGRPLLFSSKLLCNQHSRKSTYEKDTMAMLHWLDQAHQEWLQDPSTSQLINRI